MKKQHLILAICLLFVTNNFYGGFPFPHSFREEVLTWPEDLILPLVVQSNKNKREGNLSREDLVQNYLYHLDEAFKDNRYTFHDFVSISVAYANGSLTRMECPVQGKKGLRYLFVVPSDNPRMKDLEKRLRLWITYANSNTPKYEITKKGSLQRLQNTLNNKKEITKSLRISHPQLFPTNLNEQEKDDEDSGGMQWPCIIL
jgi:hypothetical protein